MPAPTAIGENNENSLTPEDIQKLTSELSAEIDQEIKKQLAEPHPLSDTQKKIDLAVKQAEEAKKLQAHKEGEEQKQQNLNSPHKELSPQTNQNLSPEASETEDSYLDPLSASVNAALADLKEGDKIDKEWVLKKTYSTSFGHNRSFFYELENASGAKWTLNQEEMKDLIKKNVTKRNEPVDLAPPGGEKPPANEEIKTLDTKELFNANLDTKKTEPKKEDPQQELGSKETAASQDKNSEDLSKEQIELIGKLHADPKTWQTFTSFSPEQVTKIQSLYEKGQLVQFGIDAHPLLDKFKTKSIGEEIDLKQGDTFESLVEKQGLPLTYSNADAVIVGLHVLANEKLLSETLKKAETAGLVAVKLPESKEIINLTKDSLNGNNQAFSKLSQLLKFLPINGKFRVLKTTEIENLKKYFT